MFRAMSLTLLLEKCGRYPQENILDTRLLENAALGIDSQLVSL
jgi:hypothetical protein